MFTCVGLQIGRSIEQDYE